MNDIIKTDVVGFGKRGDAVVSTDTNAKDAYNRQKRLFNSVRKFDQKIEDLEAKIEELKKRIEMLESK